MKRQHLIAFTHDKAGRPIAYRDDRRAMRYIRIGYEEAKTLIATGQAVQVPFRPPKTARKNPARSTKARTAATKPRKKTATASSRTKASAARSRRNVPKAFRRWVTAGMPGYLPRKPAPRSGRRHARRNLDGYVDDQGRFRPIRDSSGYSDFALTQIPMHLTAGYVSSQESDEEDYWRAEVRKAIRQVSPNGIAPHYDRKLGWEYRHDVPSHLRSRQGMPGDEVAQLINYQFPWLGIETEDDLLQALKD